MSAVAVAAAGNSGRILALRRKFRAAAVPVSGGIEITRRCNLNCVHCYLGDERTAAGDSAELDTASWLGLIDSLVAAGCLDLVFTGGEPLLRPDFGELYTRARLSGMRVTLFTNATAVSGKLIALFRDLPPAMIEASVYGSTARTHENVTGVPGSFPSFLSGIGRFRKAGLPLTIKTVLMTLNLGEFDGMAKLAADHGARWRFDPAIFPRLDGDRGPLALRIPPLEAALRDIPSRESAAHWRECYERGAAGPPSRRLYICGAGVTNFHIDPRGSLRPCLLSRQPARDLRHQDFKTAWREIVAEIAGMTVAADYRCNACDRRNICSLCPPFLEFERGSRDRPSEFLCALGDNRRERIYAWEHARG